MNSLTRRAKKAGPSITKRTSMMGNQVSKMSFKKGSMDNNTIIWIGIAVLLIVMLLGSCYYKGDSNSVDTFNNIKSGFKNIVGDIGKLGKSSTGDGNLKELDVVYFMTPSCPWCQKMSKVLSDASSMDSVTVVDVSKAEGQKIAKEMGASDKGIPAFISKKMKTGSVGFKPTVGELVESLNKTQPQPQQPAPQLDQGELVNKVQTLNIVLFVSPTCGWCNKIKSEFTEAGVLEMVEMVDVSTPEGQKVAQELIKEFRGVPASYSKATRKSSVGYKPIGDIIKALS